MIAGPTASGKSGAASALAEASGGVVINADAMQVYRDLPILTAMPGAADLARAPHLLFGVLDGTERCSAARWRAMAVAEIDAALSAGQLPIVTGGTGLYLRALMQGLAPVPKVPAAVTQATMARHKEIGAAAFHDELAARDAEMADRLAVGDRQRLVRALAVIEATGKSLAHWQRQPVAPVPYRFSVAVIAPPRETLYAACDARMEAMIEAGARDEVRALTARRLDPGLPVMKSLGVRELAEVNAGRLLLGEGLARAQRATRQYAKRQMTWLRHQLVGQENGTLDWYLSAQEAIKL